MLLGGLRNKLFARKLSELTGPAGSFTRCARITWFAAGEFHRDFCFERAATLSFATIISLIPLVVLLLGVAVQFGVGDAFIQYAQETAFPYLAPAFKNDLSVWLEKNLSRRAFANSVAGVVGLVALASLIATALGCLTAAERIFNRVWKVEGTRTYLQKLVTFWAILTVSPLIITASLWIEEFLVPRGGAIERLTQDSLALKALYGFLVPLVVGFTGFTVLYRYLPAARVRLRSAMLGALTAAVLWEVSKRAFYVYVARSSTVTSLYGPLSVVPLFLVWVYVNWVIILWGCEISYAHQNLPVLNQLLANISRKRVLSPSYIGTYLLERIARAFATGERTPTASTIGDELTVQTAEVEHTAHRLIALEILIEDARSSGTYSLAKSPRFVSLADVAAALETEEPEPRLDDAANAARAESDPDGPGRGARVATSQLFLEAKGRYLSAFAAKTLEDLIRSAPEDGDRESNHGASDAVAAPHPGPVD